MYCKSVFKTDIKSIRFGYVSTSFIADTKLILQSSNVSLTLSTIIFPQFVLLKSVIIFRLFVLSSFVIKLSSSFLHILHYILLLHFVATYLEKDHFE